jgi:hypothetical protein
VLLPAGVADWQAWRVAVPLVKQGTPADGVIISVHADAAGVPGTALASATVAPAAGPMAWMEATLDAPVTLSAGTPVWLKLTRSSGVNDGANFFQTVIDPMRRYPRGGCRRWDGAVWDVIDPDCTLAFRLWRDSATDVQLGAMLIGFPKYKYQRVPKRNKLTVTWK